MREDGEAAEGAVLAAFLIGAMAGAAVALLITPVSGSAARQLVGEKTKDGRERINEAARQGRQFLDRQVETVSSAVARGREAYEQARSGATQPGVSGPAQ